MVPPVQVTRNRVPTRLSVEAEDGLVVAAAEADEDSEAGCCCSRSCAGVDAADFF